LIDYVICHELTHGFHADHGKEWQNLLSTVMPDWEHYFAGETPASLVG
jgi:predicted metal-dependent hydrolase